MNKAAYNHQVERLFEEWRTKYNGEHFISDGIIDLETWSRQDKGKHVLFVLKELNDPECSEDRSFQQVLDKDWRAGIWRRVAEWTRGILEADGETTQYSFPKIEDEVRNEHNKIAILNLKKSPGNGRSEMKEIMSLAKRDKIEIQNEVIAIDPDIIVCGSTSAEFFAALDMTDHLSGFNAKEPHRCRYYYPRLFERERLILDFWHPAFRCPPSLSYMGIVDLYQRALQDM